MNPVELLCLAIGVAFSAAGLVMLVRLIPWVDRQMMAGKKPWVCNLCMSWWTSIAVAVTWHFVDDAPLKVEMPAFALTLLVVNVLGAAQSTPDFDVEEIPEETKP